MRVSAPPPARPNPASARKPDPTLRSPATHPAPSAPSLHGELTEDDKQYAACIAAPPEFDAAPGHLDSAVSLQRMASISALQTARLPGIKEAGPATEAARGAGSVRAGELLRMPSIQSEKKDKKAEGWRKDATANPGDDAGAAAGAGGGAATRPSVTTPEGRAALAALAREAAARESAIWGCRDPVAALVGAGYLLLRATGFSRRAPAAVEGLRRMASVRGDEGAALARAASLAAGRSDMWTAFA
jgi:hypothetical protein